MSDAITVYVICCNDSLEAAVLGTPEFAQHRLEQLRDQHFRRNRGVFRSEVDHRTRCYWHIHELNLEQEARLRTSSLTAGSGA